MNTKKPYRISDEIRWFNIAEKKQNTPPSIIKAQVFTRFYRRTTFETIVRVWTRYLHGMTQRPQKGPDRPRIFSEREERNLVREFLMTPGLSVKQAERDCQEANKPANRTIRHVLKRCGLLPKVSD